MRNIIITGGELFNKGAQAMTFITVNELKKRYPNHQIHLLSEMDLQRPQSEKAIYSIQFTGWYPIKFARCQHNPPLRLLCQLRNGAELREAEYLYKNTDLIVDISGYALGSNWNPSYCNTYLDHLEFAHSFGIPVYLMPQSFGPFHFDTPEGKKVDARIRQLLPGVKRIFAREQEGYNALVNTYGLSNVTLANDIVLNNKEITLAHVFQQLPEFDLPKIKENAVAVVPNIRNLDFLDETAMNALYKAIVSSLLEQGHPVYLLSHSSQDQRLCTAIKATFPDNENVVHLTDDFSCLEFNELVKHFRFLVASRFHAIVHAYKNAIPCIILGWAEKYHSLSTQFSQHEYMFDVRSGFAPGDIRSALALLDTRADEESKIIQPCLELIQQDNIFDQISF